MREYILGDKRLVIEQDDPHESPRDWDNLGTMVCFNRRYTLGDKHNFSDYEEFIRDLAGELGIETEFENENEGWEYRPIQEVFDEVKEKIVILPLYLYDHSGITMNTSGFACSWDSGQVGWIYCTEETIKKEYGEFTEETKEKAKRCMIGEVETYDQYLTGDVYWFKVEKKVECECCHHVEWEHIDSCGGFYGYDPLENGMTDYLDDEWKEVIKNA